MICDVYIIIEVTSMAYKNNMSDIEVVGRNLEFERLRLNMTIKEFSHQISYDRGSYSKLVRQKNQDLELKSLVRIARKLDVDLSLLLSRSYIDDYKERKREESKYVERNYLLVLTNNLKLNLEINGMCQDIGTNRETVNRLINYHVMNPRISTLSAIAYDLKVSLASLFREEK